MKTIDNIGEISILETINYSDGPLYVVRTGWRKLGSFNSLRVWQTDGQTERTAV